MTNAMRILQERIPEEPPPPADAVAIACPSCGQECRVYDLGQPWLFGYCRPCWPWTAEQEAEARRRFAMGQSNEARSLTLAPGAL